ncbi:MAG: hypothetical protein ABJB76_07545 [Candidatus Nitrosocosmicus sp.]
MGLGRSKIKCRICDEEIKDFKYIAMPEWNISEYLCGTCYSKRLTEHYIKHEEIKDKK